MIERHKKFLEYVKATAPGIDIEKLVDVGEDALKTMYSSKVYDLIFIPGCEKVAPKLINSKSVWLRAAAMFRLSNPL